MEGYPNIKKWEVYNFMSIEHGVCEFDDSNIIFLKGYNDSGKSAMLRALDVLFYNKNAQSQVQFIQDDKDYFRIVAYFEDGVIILRDKYINGQSLYEMYKDGECIFTTKVNNTLTKVSEVPEPIALYLGVLQELNTRTCYDKQFAVQTTGSENYKVFSTILKSEELAKAGELVNSDKNRLGSDIASVESKIDAYKEVVKDGIKLTDELVANLEGRDKYLDFYETLINYLSNISNLDTQLKNTVIFPEVDEVDCSEITILNSILASVNEARSIKNTPEISAIDDTELTTLIKLRELKGLLGGIREVPKVSDIDITDLEMLMRIKSLTESCNSCSDIYSEVTEITTDELVALMSIKNLVDTLPDVSSLDNEIDSVNNQIAELAIQLGDDVSICPDCGHVMLGDEGHIHRG